MWLVRVVITSIFLFSQLNATIQSGTCKPYFASIKVSELNLHVGPGKHYKIICKYVTKCLPVLVTAKYDHWRRIKDPEGTVGWVHKSQLSNKRYVIVLKQCNLVEDSNESAKLVAKIKKNVIMQLHGNRGNWCKVSVKFKKHNLKGWVSKSSIFGVFTDENQLA